MAKSLAGHFFFLKLQMSFFPFSLRGGSHVQSSLLPKFALLLRSCRHAGALWGDDLNVILFEFLDDTKLAQSCRNWLYVQHWYNVVPEPSMRVTLWALMASKPASSAAPGCCGGVLEVHVGWTSSQDTRHNLSVSHVLFRNVRCLSSIRSSFELLVQHIS